MFLLLSPYSLCAGVGRWTSSGPEGGAVLSLAAVTGQPGRILAGTESGGIFESRDGGNRWSYLGLADHTVTALASAPDGSGILYAGTDAGFFRSRDGGLTWEPRNSGLPRFSIEALVVDPREPGRIYACLYLPLLPGASGGLFRSGDGGETWAPAGLSGPGILDLVIDPRDSRVLHALAAGRYYAEVRKSVDGGATWTVVDVSPGSELALTIDPDDPNTLYAGEWDPSSGTGISQVYKSADAGATWAPVGNDLGRGFFQAILVSPVDSAVVYAGTDGGLFVSRDSGTSWARAGEAKTVALAIDPATGSVFAGGPEGVAVSPDGGATWTKESPGLIAAEIVGLGAASTDLYARTATEVFRSIDQGASWKEEPPLPPGANGFGVHPSNPLLRFAGITEVGLCRGVVRSVDGGQTWTPTSLTLGCSFRFAFDPRTPAIVYAIAQFGLWRSDDEGSNWTIVSPGDAVLSFAVDPATPTTLYAGTVSRGVFRSDDRGTTWRAVNNGIPDATSGCASDGTQCPKRRITALAVDPARSSTIYAGALDPPMYNGSAFVGGVAGVWKSADRGETWLPVGAGVSGTSDVVVALDPTDPRKVYAGTDRGVFRSLDAGATFFQFNPGLTHHVISSILVEPSGRVLHAGTRGGGVFDIELLEDRPDLIRVPAPEGAPRVVRRPGSPGA